MNYVHRCLLIVFVFYIMTGLHVSLAANTCDTPIPDDKINKHFEKLALKQMTLEFGGHGLEINGIQNVPVGPDLVRIEANLRYRKPARVEITTIRLRGWISRCNGTLIIRGNTWLADGSLLVQRFTRQQLPGSGVILGDAKAPIHIIAFVDSRCPQCHKLIHYGRELAREGKMYIEIRQVAFLETPEEGVNDTQLSNTALFTNAKAEVDIEDYMDMVSGLSSEVKLDNTTKNFNAAISVLENNTKTAKELLHFTTVPGVMYMDNYEPGAFRATSHWEMNRLFQPDL